MKKSLQPETYISPGIAPEVFRRVGSAHVHLDAEITHYPRLRQLAERFESMDMPSKINLVYRFIAGPQRTDYAFAPYYDSHTPTNPETHKESFGAFLTTLVTTRDEALSVLHSIKSLFAGTEAVAEYEQVVRNMQTGERTQRLDALKVLSPLSEADTGLPGWPTEAFEIHHGLNIKGEELPIPLEDLINITGVSVGGWFVNRRMNNGNIIWAYRSNAFSTPPQFSQDDLEVQVRNERTNIAAFLEAKGLHIPISTIVEATLNVWKFKNQP
jgi:hypothetical protein